ncbi:PepSY-associated TM helix domain-containing protein [Massilia sp. CCM 8734]|uniref:PepSY-associated TM helix domain-containing protein n=1 Tax=Massilia sp. CCM 8734 TaxID=2609283 RepID=UPI00141FBB69|nr:PepSY-associated TM helix domain-containing protein [Massilia sp. CCM 8734]NHZ96078.1 PepSY domain-containing protein [Massilia sp. CCM 8734]
MTPNTVRRWAWIHKWTSLVCTIFMLLLCLTGLPLIFHHQIGELLGNEIVAPEMAPGTPKASADTVIGAGLALYPDMVMQYMSQEADDDKIWHLTVGKTRLDPDFKSIAVDSRTGKVIRENKFEGTFMNIMLRLHADLFAGLWGMLFLGLMGFLFLIATVSGVVLYAPFMRKLQFGTVRRERASRLKWLDMHNLLGIVTLVWALVVGATGMINTWADLLLKYWQNDQLAAMIAPYKDLPAPAALGPLRPGVDAALKLEPGMQVGFIAWPGTAFSSPHHYGIFMHGKEALTSRLYKPVLVDAVTGRVTDSRDLPWYLTGLLISQPLHFGDYGGVWMQVWWALLDIATIVVLGSGLYLWRKRSRAGNPQLRGAAVAAGSAP